MTFQTGITEFAEFVGTEIKRIEKKIPDGGSNQSSSQIVITGKNAVVAGRSFMATLVISQ